MTGVLGFDIRDDEKARTQLALGICQRKIFLITFLGMLAIVGFLSLQPRNDFPSGKAGAEIEFLIQDGELGSSIATNLESKGVIKSAAKFVEEFTKDPKAQGISAGSHSIETNIPVKNAIVQLLDPKRLNNLLVVKEGSTLSDVLGLLRSNDISLRRIPVMHL